MSFKIQPSFTAGELSPSMYARVDLSKFHVGLRTCLNFITLAYGGAATRPGTLFVAEVDDSTKRHRLVRFQFSTTQAYILVFGHLTMQVIMDRGVVTSTGTPVTVVTPYTEADLHDLYFAQSADTLFVTHPSYAPRKLTRSSHTSWTLSTISFAPSVSTPAAAPTVTATGLTTGSWTVKYIYSKVGSDGSESSPSAAGSFTWNGTWTPGGKVDVTFPNDRAGGADSYVVYKNVNGFYGAIGTVQDDGSSSTFTFTDNNITPDTDDSPQEQRSPFGSSGNYPAVSSIHAQRTVWAGSNNKPSTFFGSRVGEYSNMNVSSPLKADDAYEFTLDTKEVNRVNGLCSLRELILFTTGAVHKASGDQDAAISAKSINVKAQSYWGSHGLPPIVTGESALFVEAGGPSWRTTCSRAAGPTSGPMLATPTASSGSCATMALCAA